MTAHALLRLTAALFALGAGIGIVVAGWREVERQEAAS